MTESEALKEASWRWGAAAFIRVRDHRGSKQYSVGVLTADLYSVKGTGKTWEEAFQQADRNTKKQG
jgi:hypothetical protein